MRRNTNHARISPSHIPSRYLVTCALKRLQSAVFAFVYQAFAPNSWLHLARRAIGSRRASHGRPLRSQGNGVSHVVTQNQDGSRLNRSKRANSWQSDLASKLGDNGGSDPSQTNEWWTV